MAKSVIINGVTYSSVPSVQIPLSSGTGTATFTDTSDATLTSGGSMLSGVTAYGSAGSLVTGSISSKAAATYKPSTSNQSITAGQYLSGAQTISAVTTTNLSAAYIANGVTVKVGCSSDDDCIATVTGTLASPVISQDSSTKILSIS